MPPTDITAECKEEEPGATGEIHFNVRVHGSGDLASGCGLIVPILLTDITPEDRTCIRPDKGKKEEPWDPSRIPVGSGVVEGMQICTRRAGLCDVCRGNPVPSLGSVSSHLKRECQI